MCEPHPYPCVLRMRVCLRPYPCVFARARSCAPVSLSSLSLSLSLSLALAGMCNHTQGGKEARRQGGKEARRQGGKEACGTALLKQGGKQASGTKPCCRVPRTSWRHVLALTCCMHRQAQARAPPRQEVHTPFTVVYLVNKRFLHGAPMLVKDL